VFSIAADYGFLGGRMSGLRSAVSAVVKGLGLAFETVTRMHTTLNDSSVEYNRSLEVRLEAGRIPALESEVKILETGIACPDFFGFSPRQVAGKRKKLCWPMRSWQGA
jgi:hypothetical protein